MGVRQNENEYLDAAGQPDPDAYLPAFVRRYPFVFAADPGTDRLLLCVDTAAEMVTSTPDVKFFDGDQASKFTQDAIEFCKEFERQRRATAEFVEMMDSASLFEQKSVSFTPRDAQGNRLRIDVQPRDGVGSAPRYAERPASAPPPPGSPPWCSPASPG